VAVIVSPLQGLIPECTWTQGFALDWRMTALQASGPWHGWRNDNACNPRSLFGHAAEQSQEQESSQYDSSWISRLNISRREIAIGRCAKGF
jgi:hypothetical protein